MAAPAAESPFVGSWKLAKEPLAELTLKSGGTGTLKLPDGGKTIPFTWKKTPQGATVVFDPASAPSPEVTNLFLQMGKRPGEMVVRDPKEQTTWGRDDGETRRAIEKLLQVSGMEKNIEQQNSMLMSSLRSTKTNVSAETWNKLEQEVSFRDAREEIINIYEMMYTLEDLKALNAFYESPVGKKELTTRPSVIQHALRIIQQRADHIGRAADAGAGLEKK